MHVEKIKEFNRRYDEFFAKKDEITKALADLDFIKMEVNDALKKTIDNGLSTEYLVSIVEEYRLHKFESSCVIGFIKKMSNMLLAGVDKDIVDRLEVTAIDIRVFMHDFKDRIDGPVSMTFIDRSSNRRFIISIPVADSVKTDVMHWSSNREGMYVVEAYGLENDRSREICTVFDQSKVAEAVVKYMSGGFDEELKYEFDFRDTFISKYMLMQDYYDRSMYSQPSYVDKLNDMLIDCEVLKHTSNSVYGVIDDVDDYAVE